MGVQVPLLAFSLPMRQDLPPPRRPTAGLSLVAATAAVYSALVVVAVGWGLLDGFRNIWVHPGHELSRTHLLRHTSWGALAGIALGLLVVGASRALTALSGWGKRLHMEFHAVLRGLSWWDAFVIALFSALGEEALFRGAMQPTVGLWITAAAFGVMHAPVRRALWPWPLLAFAMGLAFGVLYRVSGDLAGPVLAHFTINFLNLGHIARTRYEGFESADPAPPLAKAPAPPDEAPASPRSDPSETP